MLCDDAILTVRAANRANKSGLGGRDSVRRSVGASVRPPPPPNRENCVQNRPREEFRLPTYKLISSVSLERIYQIV